VNTPPPAPRELDSFESALLTELRAHVADRPLPETVPEPTRSRPHYRRWAAGLAVAAAAATAFVVGSAGGPAVGPAYAVAQEADGDVVVTIHRLEDSEGLEAALHEKGIDAEVSFERITIRLNVFPFPYDGELPPKEVGMKPDCASDPDPATLSGDGEDWVLLIPAESPLQDRHVYLSPTATGSLELAYRSVNNPRAYCTVFTAGD
jgi:hypothetical protein